MSIVPERVISLVPDRRVTMILVFALAAVTGAPRRTTAGLSGATETRAGPSAAPGVTVMSTQLSLRLSAETWAEYQRASCARSQEGQKRSSSKKVSSATKSPVIVWMPAARRALAQARKTASGSL